MTRTKRAKTSVVESSAKASRGRHRWNNCNCRRDTFFALHVVAAVLVLSSAFDVARAQTGTWSKAQLSVPRCCLAGTSAGIWAIFAGGFIASTDCPSCLLNIPSNAVDMYNSATGVWTRSNLSQARGGLAATSVGNVAFFAGGFATGAQCCNSTRKFA